MDMTLSKLVNHTLQLEETEVLEIDAKKFRDVQQQEALDISTKIKSEVCSDKEGYSYIQIELKPASEDFYLKVIIRGKFLSEDALGQKQFDDFLLVQGVKILWSYAREVIYDITGKMLRKAFLLPTLDVTKTLTNAKIQNRDVSSDGND